MESPAVLWLCGTAAIPATGACSLCDNMSDEPRPQPSYAANNAQSLKLRSKILQYLYSN